MSTEQAEHLGTPQDQHGERTLTDAIAHAARIVLDREAKLSGRRIIPDPDGVMWPFDLVLLADEVRRLQSKYTLRD